MSDENIAAAALARPTGARSGISTTADNQDVRWKRGPVSKEQIESCSIEITSPAIKMAPEGGVSASYLVQTKEAAGDKTKNSSRSSNNISKKGKKGKESFKFPVEPRVIQVIKKPRTYMNHSYRDFSSLPCQVGDEFPKEISEMTFPQKVHHILSQPEHSKFISWQPHGRAFRISIPKMFETTVCHKYFQHSRYSSFLRQLSNYGFKHMTQGLDRNCYYHEVNKMFPFFSKGADFLICSFSLLLFLSTVVHAPRTSPSLQIHAEA